MLFSAGSRPSANDVERLLVDLSKKPRGRGLASIRIVSNNGEDQGWLELLAKGLTFDLSGLAPAASREVPPSRHKFGLPSGFTEGQFEALALLPGPHLAGGGKMLLVVKAMAAVAGELAQGLGAQAVCWLPAGSWMDPGYFERAICNWNAGGAFPALGMTGVLTQSNELIESDGLAFFNGQEVQIEPRLGEPAVETVKLAVRVIDHLVHLGPLSLPDNLTGPDGTPMRLEPSADGRRVKVIRTL